MEKTEEKGIINRVSVWFRNLTVKGLLGAILVAFVVIIILMSVSYLPSILSRVSSSLSAALYSVFVPADNATVTTDKKIINTGEDFNITFKKGDALDGIYTISYSCDSNTEILSVEASGLKKVDCGTPYYLLNNETSIKLRPNTKDTIARLVIDGAFENNDTQKIESVGTIRVTVKNEAAGVIVNPSITTPANTVAPVTKPVTPAYIAPAVQPTYYGKPDLAVRTLQVGILSNNNIVTNQTQFSYGDMVGIKFEVRNDGDANTGFWSFTAVLPSISTPAHTSPTQISLKPGESIIFTLGFSGISNQYTNLITINVDPQNSVAESIEYNNILTSTITNTSYNSNYYNNNNSNNGCYINGVYTYNCNNGCYVNGMFTYNCNNNYNNGWDYNYNYNNYNDLRVSCYTNTTNPEEGDKVKWYANVSGGDGDYNYEWTGTDDLDSSSKNPSITYDNHGWKYATVTVESDGYSVSQTCSVYVDNN